MAKEQKVLITQSESEINSYLQKGWCVKFVTALPYSGTTANSSNICFTLERDVDTTPNLLKESNAILERKNALFAGTITRIAGWNDNIEGGNTPQNVALITLQEASNIK